MQYYFLDDIKDPRAGGFCPEMITEIDINYIELPVGLHDPVNMRSLFRNILQPIGQRPGVISDYLFLPQDRFSIYLTSSISHPGLSRVKSEKPNFSTPSLHRFADYPDIKHVLSRKRKIAKIPTWRLPQSLYLQQPLFLTNKLLYGMVPWFEVGSFPSRDNLFGNVDLRRLAINSFLVNLVQRI
ncbi:hypothetical protein CR919_19180 [Stenotrophomonas sp. LMG 10879]|nr:hypothetical protein CR919_19180 [Stenotrophomonas sp. LMG 10879]